MIKLSLTSLLVGLVALCYGQSDFRNGYVINHTKDSLFGLVNYRQGNSAYHSCDFKRTKDENVTTYRPEEISGYGFVNDTYFQSREIEDTGKMTTVFLEVIVKGLGSLYRFERTYFVEKNNQGLKVLSNVVHEGFVNGKKVMRSTNAHIATVGMLFFDCVELRDDIREFDLKERTLTDIVEAYNKCQGQPGITYKANKPWVKALISATGGIASSVVKDKAAIASATDYMAAYEVPKVPFAGILFDVSSPRLYEPLAFHAGVLYQKSKFYGYGLYDEPGFTVRNYITIEAQSVKVPAGLRYTFPQRKITAFLNAGAAFTLNVGLRGSAVHEREVNNVVEIFYRDDFTMPRSHLAYWAGVGGIIKLPYRFDGVVELRYERSSKVIIAHLPSDITTFQLMLGIRTK